MKKNANEIIQISYEEAYFSPELFDAIGSRHFFLSSDGILSYEMKRGSRKREDVKKVAVPQEEMKSFFSRIYKFVRTADRIAVPVDDCGYKITILYLYHHKEIIENSPVKDGRYMVDMISAFLSEHGIK